MVGMGGFQEKSVSSSNPLEKNASLLLDQAEYRLKSRSTATHGLEAPCHEGWR